MVNWDCKVLVFIGEIMNEFVHGIYQIFEGLN